MRKWPQWTNDYQLYYGTTMWGEAREFAAYAKKDSALLHYLLSVPNKIRIVLYADMSSLSDHQKIIKNKRMVFMCEKWFVITLTPNYRTWVLLYHKRFCQLKLHTAIDPLNISSQATKDLVPPDSMKRWTDFPFWAGNMLQFKGTYLLRLWISPCATEVKSMFLDNTHLPLHATATL